MEREQQLAIELNPNYSEGHRRYGLLRQDLGRFEEARIHYRRALEIDPLSPVTNFQNAQVLFFEGNLNYIHIFWRLSLRSWARKIKQRIGKRR